MTLWLLSSQRSILAAWFLHNAVSYCYVSVNHNIINTDPVFVQPNVNVDESFVAFLQHVFMDKIYY